MNPPAGIDPKPPTASLLPLRPKSCHPRMRQTEIVITPQERVMAVYSCLNYYVYVEIYQVTIYKTTAAEIW